MVAVVISVMFFIGIISAFLILSSFVDIIQNKIWIGSPDIVFGDITPWMNLEIFPGTSSKFKVGANV